MSNGKQVTFCIIFSIVITPIFPILKNIKDTYNILNDDYKHYSLVHGAVAWETGIIRNMYDFGPIFPKFGIDQERRKIINGYLNPNETSKLIRLVHALFHRVNQDSTSAADFNVSGQITIGQPQEIAECIAGVCFRISQLRELTTSIKKLLAQRNQYLQENQLKNYLVELKALENIPAEKKKFETNKKIFKEEESSIKLLSSLLESITDLKKAQANFESYCKKIKIDSLKNECDTFLNAYTSLTKLLTQLLNQTPTLKWEIIAPAIISTFRECDAESQELLYPKHILETVLLAFLYKKCSHDRKSIRAFYNKLHEKNDNKILKVELSDAWENEEFQEINRVDALKSIETIVDQEKQFHTIFEPLTYYALQIKGISASNYLTVSLKNYENTKLIFSDCMENSILNFIVALSYDGNKNTVTLQKLCQSLGKNQSDLDPQLDAFFKEIKSFSDLYTLKVHNHWATIVSNINNIAYKQNSKDPKQYAYGKGYIRIHEQNDQEAIDKLVGQGYEVISEPNFYLYNMRTSLKNFIVIIDHLLKLNLFANNQPDLENQQFVKKYFSQLCSKLLLDSKNCFIAKDKTATGSDGTDPDFEPKSNDAIFAFFKLSEGLSFRLTIQETHADPNIIEQSGDLQNQLISLIRNKIVAPGEFPIVSDDTFYLLLTALTLNKKEDFSKPVLNNIILNRNLFTSVFAFPLNKIIVGAPYMSFMKNYMKSYSHPKIKCWTNDVFLRAAARNGSDNDNVFYAYRKFFTDVLQNKDLHDKRMQQYCNEFIKHCSEFLKKEITVDADTVEGILESTLSIIMKRHIPNPEYLIHIIKISMHYKSLPEVLQGIKDCIRYGFKPEDLIKVASNFTQQKNADDNDLTLLLWDALFTSESPEVVKKSEEAALKAIEMTLSDTSTYNTTQRLVVRMTSRNNPTLFEPIAKIELIMLKNASDEYEENKVIDKLTFLTKLHQGSVLTIATFKEFIESAEKSGDPNLVRKAEKLKSL